MIPAQRKILIDINHPAHVHFFKNPVRTLVNKGHDVLITSRDKEFASTLLAGLNLEFRVLSRPVSSGIISLMKELVVKDYRLYRLIKQERPDVLASIGGTFIAHAGYLSRTPSLVFYDTEIAKLQNMITYPLCSRLYVPDCYSGRVPEHKTIRYRGYHELSYLHPSVFTPDRNTAVTNGLDPARKNIFVRLVSWAANHDVGYDGISEVELCGLINRLFDQGNVIISSEKPLPEKLAAYCYRGNISDVHHVLAFCDIYIGESATMASESAILGVPAIYMSDSYRGYMDDMEKRYGLVKNVKQFDLDRILEDISHMLSCDKSIWKEKRSRLLQECINVSDFVVDCILKN